MKHTLLIAVLFFSGLACRPGRAAGPNVLLVVVDDMGYSDLGCYGGEIETPNLDALAQNGIRFTQFYNTARCWSTRSSLMSGYYAQQIRSDPVEHEKKLPDWAALLPHYLKPLGYRCYHSGKWHVPGAPRPVADGGFDRSYVLHDHDRNFNPKNHWLDDVPLPAVELNSGHYSTVAITDRTLEQLDEHAREFGEQPFFAYTAYTVPHFPLQALPEDIEKYKEVYLKGWDAIREERLNRLRAMGLVNCDLSAREEQCGPPYRFANVPGNLGPGEVLSPYAWDSLNEEQRRFQTTKAAIHAAMVDRVDQEVGRILEKLKEMNAFENTIVFFLSDNGASAEIMIRGDGHDPNAPPGSAGSYLCLGPGWSTSSNTPFRRHKVWNQEGGISTPLIVHWPRGISASGRLRNDVGHVVDLVPTVLDLCGGKKNDVYHGVKVPEFPGISLRAAIERSESAAELSREYAYFQHEGNGALRVGDWKCLYTKTGVPAEHPTAEASHGTEGWALYDLGSDRCEEVDLAERHPEKLAELVGKWRELTERFQKDQE